MSFTERTSVSGTALSYLLKECISSTSRQEGFLFGNITKNVTNHISDSRSNNAKVEILINITSMLPVPESGLFYSPSGVIKQDILKDILDGVPYNVVGWYHFRQNNGLKPTLRDKLISKSLMQHFCKKQVKYFIYCSITSKQSLSNSTHTYSYRFYKVNKENDLEPLIDLTNNLGETMSGYKRSHSDKNDEFNKAVMDATTDGIHGAADAIKITLEKAVSDAAQWETKSRELTSDINCMLAMLANHYQAKQSNISKNIVREEEELIIKPIADIVSMPALKRPEPFDFVNDMIKNNLKSNSNDGSKFPNNFTENVNNVGHQKNKTASSASTLGQKRTHSGEPSNSEQKIMIDCHSPNWDTFQTQSPHTSQSSHPNDA